MAQEDVAIVYEEAKESMERAIRSLRAELQRVRTGRASTALLDGIQSIADNSFITFSWTDDGTGALTCTRIGSSTQSFYLPKIKSNL